MHTIYMKLLITVKGLLVYRKTLYKMDIQGDGPCHLVFHFTVTVTKLSIRQTPLSDGQTPHL